MTRARGPPGMKATLRPVRGTRWPPRHYTPRQSLVHAKTNLLRPNLIDIYFFSLSISAASKVRLPPEAAACHTDATSRGMVHRLWCVLYNSPLCKNFYLTFLVTLIAALDYYWRCWSIHASCMVIYMYKYITVDSPHSFSFQWCVWL